MNIYLGASGAICPTGHNLKTIFTAMMAGQSGVQLVENAFGLGKDEYLGLVPEEFINSGEATRLRGMMSSSIEQTLKGLKNSALLEQENARVILCTTKGEIDELEKGDPEPAQLYKLAGFLKEKYNLYRNPVIVSSACISGLLGIINAARMIRQGAADHVLVIGADLVTRFTLSGFISFYATAPGVCKPYDKNREGINLGEAAASVVVSNDPEIFTEISGKYLGGASANDANHISGPSRTGEGLFRSVTKAMTEVELGGHEIDFISAHGTATVFNDEMEAIAFDRLKMSNIPLNSMKGYFGHTLGAAGLLETLIGLESLKQNTLLRSLGFEEQGTSKRITVLQENMEGNFKTMLKTSSGFGGSNAAAIFEVV